jgi:uncharacterized protein YlxW (UPF0749 family)
LAAPTIADADLPVTGETSTDVPKASVFQVAEKAAEAAADKAQDAEYAETARAKERAPLEAERERLRNDLKTAQDDIDRARSSTGRASPYKIQRKRDIESQLEALEAELAAIGGRRRKTRRRRPTRSTRRR